MDQEYKQIRDKLHQVFSTRTQIELAQKLGVQQGWLSGFFNKRRNPGSATLKRFRELIPEELLNELMSNRERYNQKKKQVAMSAPTEELEVDLLQHFGAKSRAELASMIGVKRWAINSFLTGNPDLGRRSMMKLRMSVPHELIERRQAIFGGTASTPQPMASKIALKNNHRDYVVTLPGLVVILQLGAVLVVVVDKSRVEPISVRVPWPFEDAVALRQKSRKLQPPPGEFKEETRFKGVEVLTPNFFLFRFRERIWLVGVEGTADGDIVTAKELL